MKFAGSVILVLALLFSCRQNPSHYTRPLVPEDVRQVRLQGRRPHHFAQLNRIVRLENHPEALLGWIDRVVVGPQDELFVLDRRSTGTLYRFDAHGRFQKTVGRKGDGPGEYERIEDFAVLPNGTCFVIESNKIHRFDADSIFLEHKKSAHVLRQGHALGSRLLVSQLWSRKENHPLLLIFDENMRDVGGFGRRDPAFDKIRLVPQRFLSVTGTHIYAGEFYKTEIHRFDYDGQPLHRFVFPNSRQDVLDRLDQEPLTPEDEDFVLQNLHSFYQIRACDRFLYLVESTRDLGTRRPSIFFPDKKTSYVFDSDRLSRDGESLETDHIQGIYGQVLIQVVFEENSLRRLEGFYPSLVDVHLKPSDNPILLFLDLSGWHPE